MKLRSIILILLLAPISLQAGNWIQRASFGSHGRHRGTAISIGNRGYMGLGHYNGAGPNIVMRDWWEYDPSTNAWAQKSDYPNVSGAYAVLAFGMQQYGYIGGGQTAINTSFYRYDPATNSWSLMANSPTIPMNNEGFVISNKGYYISGSQLYEYNASTNTWATKNMCPFSIGVWNSAFVVDGKGYVKSGLSLWEYKPSTDQWIQRAQFPGLASGGSIGFSQRGKGYIVSGYAGWLSEVNSEVWEFDPASNSWSQLEEFPGTGRRFGSGFSIGDRSFIGIGTNGTNFNDFWEFNKLLDLESLAAINFNLFPNPTVDNFVVHTSSSEKFEISISDLIGREVHRQYTQGKETIVSTNMLSGAGTYVVRILHQGILLKTKKIVVN